MGPMHRDCTEIAPRLYRDCTEPTARYASGGQLHYYQEKRMQLQVNAAGALLHDWAKEQRGIRQLIDDGRVALLPQTCNQLELEAC